MTPDSDAQNRQFLGIEGGGTRSIAILADGHGRLLRRLEAGPANLKLLSDAHLTRHFQSLASISRKPDAIGIGLAGAWAEVDQRRIRAAAAKVWPNVPCYATSDLEVALTAAAPLQSKNTIPQVLIVSGTGSGCYGKLPNGDGVKIGSWGHVLGDKGSAYEIALSALQAVVDEYDRRGSWPALGQRILRALELNEPNDLIDWAQATSKTELASLGVEVFSAHNQGDRIAKRVLAEAAEHLARVAVRCARRVTRKGGAVQFILAGGILLKQPSFARQVSNALRRHWPKSKVSQLAREGVWGAVELAARHLKSSSSTKGSKRRGKIKTSPPSASTRGSGPLGDAITVSSFKMSPTERRNPRSRNLHKLSLNAAISLMLSEDATIPRKLMQERSKIVHVVQAISRAFKTDGRLFYVGAGTSGRLGVLDASECPPTFRTSPDLVQGIIAGSQTALWKSVEGAEDDAEAGARAIEFRRVTGHDVIIGIAASGTTPFVWGALREAMRRRAKTVLVCFNPYLRIPSGFRPDILIGPNLGPELLTGSTRLKAGTATKLLLNIFTTLAMVRCGKVMSNLMVDLQPANVKLRDRATRIVMELTGGEYDVARRTLERHDWVIKKAAAALTRKRHLRAS